MMMEPTGGDRAFVEGCALLDLRGLVGTLRVGGRDAEDYLQRMISADLHKVTAARGARSTLMTGKGKLIAPFEIFRLDDAFLCVVEESALAGLREGLERCVILEEVVVEGRGGEGGVISLQGPAARMVLREAAGVEDPPEEPFGIRAIEAAASASEALLIRRPRSHAGGWDVILDRDFDAALLQRFLDAGAIAVDEIAIERARLDAGLARFGIDATDKNLPPECGCEDAISYDKGCYAGQEVVARIRTYGHVNRLLRRVLLEGSEVPGPGDPILIDGKEAGTVTSAALSPRTGHAVAPGFVRYRQAAPGTQAAVLIGGRPAVGRLEELGG
ncbi:MAG: YgfZ/GcvT domain-containing protein [Planctomycetota bacterium]